MPGGLKQHAKDGTGPGYGLLFIRSHAEMNMVLTYSTIFLASLIVAMIAFFLYRLVANASRSVSRASKRAARSGDILGVPTGKASLKHASAHPAPPQAYREQKATWPYREDKSVAIGSAYKVKRKPTNRDNGKESGNKPWGW